MQLALLTGEKRYEKLAQQQLQFMSVEARHYPPGYAMFLMALSDFIDTPGKITIVLKDHQKPEDLSCKIPLNTVISVLEGPTKEYPLKQDKTTFYVCQGRTCQPPVNELETVI